MKTQPQQQTEFTIVPSAVPTCEAVIYEYGLRIDKDSMEAVLQQITLSRCLYNDIVAIIRDMVNAAHAFVIDKAGVEAVRTQEEINSLNEAFKAAKAHSDEPEMKRVAQERREKWAALSGLLKGARKEYRAQIQERFFSKIGRNSACLTYQKRSQAVAAGLGWGTANAVLDAALQAFKKSISLGKAPRFASGAEIDQDCLTLQFTAAGGVSAKTLLSGRGGDLVLSAAGGCGRRKYGEFQFRLGAAKANTYANGTWQYHRPIPEGAYVALARLVRRRIGMHYKWAVQLLVKPKEPLRCEVGSRKPLAAVHFGWAADISGRRIAAIANDAEPGAAQIIVLPPSIELWLIRSAEIQGIRDAERDEIAVKARQIDLPDGASENLQELLGRLRRTRPQDISANRLHYLCRLLRTEDNVPDWLEAWRKEDRMKWQDQTHIARRARNARRSFYRELAIRLASEYDAIAIEPLDLVTAALKVDEKTGEKTEFAKKARAGRVVAALYELESSIRWAAAKTGAALLEITGPTASTCAICGGSINAAEDDHQELHCNECGAVLDRKKNGAAIAWQAVNDQREDVVTAFWSSMVAESQAKKEKKAEQLAKMVDGRRKARTTSDAKTE